MRTHTPTRAYARTSTHLPLSFCSSFFFHSSLRSVCAVRAGPVSSAAPRRLFSDDSHDDFKPVSKAPGDLLTVEEDIEQSVSQNPVFIFMKGTPERPMCGFSNMACRILDAHNVVYSSADVLSDPELREGIKAYTHWPTIPQVFIKGEFVGGSDILLQMHQSGDLDKELEGLPRFPENKQ